MNYSHLIWAATMKLTTPVFKTHNILYTVTQFSHLLLGVTMSSAAFNLLPIWHREMLHGIHLLLIVYGLSFSLLLSLSLSPSVTLGPPMLLCAYLALRRFKPNSVPFVRPAALKRTRPSRLKKSCPQPHRTPLTVYLSLQLPVYPSVQPDSLSKLILRH